MAGIKIELLSDVKSLLRGTGDAEAALDKVAGSLDDVARDGTSSTAKLETSFRDLASAADTMERSFRDSFDAVKKEAKTSFTAVGDDAHVHTKRAGEATAAFKDEAKQNFAETASSFDGSMSSVADMAQSTLGGLAASLPGVGVVVGLAGAAAGAWLGQWTQSQADFKEVHNSMLDDLVASEGKYLSDSYVQEQYWAILKGESKIIKEKDLQAIVRETGLTEEQVALGFAGNSDLMGQARDRLIEREKVFKAQLEDNDATNDSAAQAGIDWIDQMIGAVDRQTGAVASSKAEVERALETNKRWGTGTVESVDEARSKYDGLGRVIAGLPNRSLTVTVEPDFTVFDRLLKNKTGSVGVYVTPRAGTPVL